MLDEDVQELFVIVLIAWLAVEADDDQALSRVAGSDLNDDSCDCGSP